MATKVWHVLPDVGVENWVPFAKSRALLMWESLERNGKRPANKVLKIPDRGKNVWITIRIHAPNIWIRIWAEECPKPLSGLIHVKDPLQPIVVDAEGVAALREFYPKEEPRAWRDESKFGTNGAQSLLLRPTMYSGEMRKVVQILMGQGVAIPFNYSWSQTHGIFTSSTGGKWVIEISDQGIFAWSLRVCMQGTNPTLGYTPLPTERPDSPRELLGQEAMEAFYSGASGFSNAMGWAFSAGGGKAANIEHRVIDFWSYSKLWVATIAENSDGEPISASIAVSDEGWIHGPKNTHMKYPRSDNIALYSFDVFRSNTNYIKECKAPVFCFYEGESLETVYYNHRPTSKSTRVVNNYAQYGLHIHKEGVLFESSTYIDHALPYFSSTKRPQNPSSTSWSGTTVMYRQQQAPGLIVTDIGVLNATAVHCITSEDVSGGFDTRSHVDMFVMPLSEREGFYLITAATKNVSIPMVRQQQNGGFGLQYGVTCVAPCTATASVSCITVSIGVPTTYAFSDAEGPYYGQLGGLTNTTFPGAPPGAVFEWRFDKFAGPNNGDLCEIRPISTFSCPGGTQVFTFTESGTTYSGGFFGSGNFRSTLNEQLADFYDWFTFIEHAAVYQAPQCVRDAFDPNTYALSLLPRQVMGFEMKDGFGDYPLENVNFFFHFVGEP